MNEQASLSDFGGTQEEVTEHTPGGDDGSHGPDLPDASDGGMDPLAWRLSDDATMDDRSCPWCLDPVENFRVGGPTGLGCTNCGSAIPKDADWYRNGEKIIL